MRAIRIEIPDELYSRFKKCVDEDYSNVTTVARSLIVDYVRGNEFRPGYVKDSEGGGTNDKSN